MSEVVVLPITSSAPRSPRGGGAIVRRRSLLERARDSVGMVSPGADGESVSGGRKSSATVVRRRASLLERGGRPVVRSIAKIGRRCETG